MDLKKKLKSIVSRQGTQFPPAITEGISTKDLSSQQTIVKKDDIQESNCDPAVEEEILNSVENIYYSDDTFDSSEFVLKGTQFPPAITEGISTKDLSSQQTIVKKYNLKVSKKVLDLILQNQSAYTLELQRVTELQKNLETASSICAASRSIMGEIEYKLSETDTKIWIQETDVRLGELLEEEDYPGAIQLCLECQKAASTFKHYKCICDLSSKLKDTLVMTEEQLDVALSKVCCQFDKTYYEKLQAAYKLLGKTQTAMDQLLMHFTSAIHNKAFVIVLGYVELCAGQSETNFQKRQYTDLCKHITAESFTPCLINLCKALWEIMCSYWCIVEWHEENVNTSKYEEINNSHLEAEFSHNYIKQKLECGLLRIWQDVQQKVKTYISSCDLSSFKFDEFIKILDIVRRLMDIGEEFCESKSEDLQESLRKQSLNYFRNYHRSYLEELRMFLENESWELCPVRTTFSILHLQVKITLLNKSKKYISYCCNFVI
ncbi:syndetin-like [Centruroides sculpturatus]|uniref:syndetin-like n=1 Tax=Centruroides sculpturatus TaxID=218467 RepID=UPI000C6D65F1|nr:syndetin-like [Centruroides sculpturatus]